MLVVDRVALLWRGNEGGTAGAGLSSLEDEGLSFLSGDGKHELDCTQG